VLEIGEKELEKSWQCTANSCSVWVHRTVRWCTGPCPVCQASPRWTGHSRDSTAAYGYNSPDCPVLHRTVRWVVRGEVVALGKRISGVRPPDCLVVHRTVRWANGRPRNPWVTRGPRQRSTGGTGLSGVHRTVSGAPTATNLQRSAAPK
jgi:hypothetical protein